MRKEYYTILLTLLVIQVKAKFCPENFVSIGKFCYHFSDIKENWDGARGVCAGIGSLTHEYIIPAVLDLGSTIDNQLFLNEVNNTSKDYWLGGYVRRAGSSQTCVINRWQWIYHKDKEIDLHANYWMNDQPNTGGDCVETINYIHGGRSSYSLTKNKDCIKTTNYAGIMSYIQTEVCSEKINVVCQIIPKEYGFRDILGSQFYFSVENNISSLNWTAARNVCQSIIPPEQSDYVDLAILDDNTGQELLKIIAQQGSDVWLGGRIVKIYDNTLLWIDGSEINLASYFWDKHNSNCLDIYDHGDSIYGYDWNILASVTTTARQSTAKLCLSWPWPGPNKLGFVCQAYKNQTSTMQQNKITNT